MALTRARQFGIKAEASEGTAESITAAECAVNAENTEYTLKIGNYERKFDRASFTPQKMLPGPASLSIKTVIECVGGTASTQAPWHHALRASGFARTAVVSQTIDDTIGGTAPVVGTLIGNNASQGSATKVARLVHIVTTSGAKKIWYSMVTGVAFVASDTIYGYDGGSGVIDPTAVSAAAGHLFTPTTETESAATESATVQERIGGEVITAVGARGTCKFMIKHGEPLKFETEMTGLPVLEDDGGGLLQFPQAAPISGVASPGTPARVAKGLAPFLMDAYSPVATTFDIDMGNTVTLRPTIGTGTGTVTDCGYLPPRITDRKIVATFDPEQPALATFNFTKKMVNVVTHLFHFMIGNIGDTVGCLKIIGPAVQLTGDATAGDRDGIVIRNLTALFTGSQDDELFLAHIF